MHGGFPLNAERQTQNINYEHLENHAEQDGDRN